MPFESSGWGRKKIDIPSFSSAQTPDIGAPKRPLERAPDENASNQQDLGETEARKKQKAEYLEGELKELMEMMTSDYLSTLRKYGLGGTTRVPSTESDDKKIWIGLCQSLHEYLTRARVTVLAPWNAEANVKGANNLQGYARWQAPSANVDAMSEFGPTDWTHFYMTQRTVGVQLLSMGQHMTPPSKWGVPQSRPSNFINTEDFIFHLVWLQFASWRTSAHYYRGVGPGNIDGFRHALDTLMNSLYEANSLQIRMAALKELAEWTKQPIEAKEQSWFTLDKRWGIYYGETIWQPVRELYKNMASLDFSKCMEHVKMSEQKLQVQVSLYDSALKQLAEDIGGGN